MSDLFLPQYKPFFILYILATGVYCYGLVWKNKVQSQTVTFLLSWFLIMGSYTLIVRLKIPGISFFEIQPDRFLFLYFSGLLFGSYFLPKKKLVFFEGRPIGKPQFERIVEFYLVFVVLSLLVNIKSEGFADVVVEITSALTSWATYLIVKKYVDKPMIKIIGIVIIATAVISSLIAILQLAVDNHFMRIGDNRFAFGNVLRSNGILSREYNHSYFLIIAMIWAMVGIHNDLLKFSLIGLFLVGVLCSFMRMSWIIAFMVFFMYIVQVRKVKFSALITMGMIFTTIVLIILSLFSKQIFGSKLVEERLSDGIESRYGYYEMVLTNFHKKPLFGFGGRKNKVYSTWMLRITGQEERATGELGGIHNGYLSNLFFYGVPAFILFAWFVIQMINYFWPLTKISQFYAIPLFCTILYLVANLTNSFLLNKYLAMLIFIHIGLGVGAYRKKIF